MPSVAHIIRRRRNRKQRRRLRRLHNRLWATLVLSVVAALVVVPLLVILGLAGWLYGRAVDVMPSPAQTIYLDPIIGPTNLYDRTGEQLIFAVQDPLGDERIWLDIETLPPHVLDATLRMEDPDYLEVGGFRADVTLTRLWRYILGTGNRRDTSLAGRLAEQTLIPPARESGLDDDLLRIALTAEVQRQYAPRRVLEWYLNTAYYGNDAYGIDAAAQVYLGKSALDLSLDEAAMLAAIPPAPQFNPFDDERAARGRQADLLRLMLENGDVAQDVYDVAIARQTRLRTSLVQVPALAPDFAGYAREQAEDILFSLGLDGARLISRGGLTITTTLDLAMYDQAECVLRAHLQQLANGSQQVNARGGEPCFATAYLRDVRAGDAAGLPDSASLMLMEASTGELRVLIGAADRPTEQPGPTLHPFVYLTGFLNGNFTPATMLLDIPQPFPGAADGLIYTPTNADGAYRGPINLRDAMVSHLRTPVTIVADREGLSSVLAIAHGMGLNSLNNTERATYDLSIIERGGNVSLLDMTYAYSVFATQGVMRGVDTTPVARNYRARNPVAVLRIEDANGDVLWAYDDERRALSQTNILKDNVAYLINDILADNDTRRNTLNIPAEALNIGRPAALVNGLTGDRADSWTVGYTPQLVLGVHLDRDDGEALAIDALNTQGSAPIWQALMRFAHDRYALQAATWPRPQGLADYVVCERSGLTPTDDNPCPRRTEVFLEARPPTQEDIYWQRVEINSDTGLRATLYTPEFLIEEAEFFVPPAPALDWWRSQGYELPPQEFDTVSLPDTFSSVQLFLPQDFAFIGGDVDVRGSIDTNNLDVFQLSYGEGFNPSQWFQIGEARREFVEGTSLGVWDTSGLDGSYTLRLTVTRTDNSVENDSVPVTVDNVPPTVEMQMATLYRWPTETVIPVNARVEDNRAIDRVEFYHNGSLVNVDTEWPYGFEWPIEAAGAERFTATAFDEVGNNASAEIEVEVQRGG